MISLAIFNQILLSVFLFSLLARSLMFSASSSLSSLFWFNFGDFSCISGSSAIGLLSGSSSVQLRNFFS